MPLVYLDTNIFIAAFEARSLIAKPTQEFFKMLEKSPRAAATSEITIAELTGPSDNPDAMAISVRRRVYPDLLVGRQFIDLLPVTRDVLRETSGFREVAAAEGRKLRLLDAIHLVSARISGCTFLLSDDVRMRQLPHGMRALSGAPADIDIVLSAL